MIDPWIKDVWSGSCKNEIYLHDSQLIGAGVSLRVLMYGLKDQDLIWFSSMYGMHRDNCIALGVAHENSLDLEKNNPDTAPIRTASRGDYEIEEYQLTGSVQSALGVVVSDNGHDEELHEGETKRPRTMVHVHDDCFFMVKPAEDETLRSVVHAILQQHSFYLQREVNWKLVLDEFIQILSSVPVMELKSDPDRARLTLTVKNPDRKFLAALIEPRSRYVIDVSTGTASFIKRPLDRKST